VEIAWIIFEFGALVFFAGLGLWWIVFKTFEYLDEDRRD